MLDMKRILIIFIVICIVMLSIFIVYNLITKKDREEINEIIPEEEITDEQMRQTIISLYFKSGQSLIPEARLIDVKDLLNNPYEKLLNMLIEGPKNLNVEKTIPEGTKINKIVKDADNLLIDFSKEFIENHTGGEKEEKLTIDSIVKTLTELTEINSIKILIDGQENKSFKDGEIIFNNKFERN